MKIVIHVYHYTFGAALVITFLSLTLNLSSTECFVFCLIRVACRSNGFEQKRYQRMADKKAVQEAAYKWSVEDM